MDGPAHIEKLAGLLKACMITIVRASCLMCWSNCSRPKIAALEKESVCCGGKLLILESSRFLIGGCIFF